MNTVQVQVTRPMSYAGKTHAPGDVLTVAPTAAAELHSSTRARVVDPGQWPAINDAMSAEIARQDRASQSAERAAMFQARRHW